MLRISIMKTNSVKSPQQKETKSSYLIKNQLDADMLIFLRSSGETRDKILRNLDIYPEEREKATEKKIIS